MQFSDLNIVMLRSADAEWLSDRAPVRPAAGVAQQPPSPADVSNISEHPAAKR